MATVINIKSSQYSLHLLQIKCELNDMCALIQTLSLNFPFRFQYWYVLSMGTLTMKVEWKCTTSVSGVRSVVMGGALTTPTSSVDSSATLLRPRPGRMLTLVKDRDRFYWTMLDVMEMSQTSISVIIVDGLITTVVTARMPESLVISQLLNPVSYFNFKIHTLLSTSSSNTFPA